MAGRSEIIEHFGQAVLSDKVSHAYIAAGDVGPGRREAAMFFAGALLCENGGAEPCGACRACRQVQAGTHPDLIMVSHEKPNSIGVEDIRLQVSDTIGIRPLEGIRKVYIIDEAEKMTVQAQNALLKTIEEPPAYAVLILLAASSDALLETVRSRCIILEMDGQENPEEYEEYASVMRELGSLDTKGISEVCGRIRSYADVPAFLDFARMWLREVLVYKTTGGAGSGRKGPVIPGGRDQIARAAGTMSLRDIQESLEALDAAGNRLQFNVNTDMTLLLMLMAMNKREGK